MGYSFPKKTLKCNVNSPYKFLKENEQLLRQLVQRLLKNDYDRFTEVKTLIRRHSYYIKTNGYENSSKIDEKIAKLTEIINTKKGSKQMKALFDELSRLKERKKELKQIMKDRQEELEALKIEKDNLMKSFIQLPPDQIDLPIIKYIRDGLQI